MINSFIYSGCAIMKILKLLILFYLYEYSVKMILINQDLDYEN